MTDSLLVHDLRRDGLTATVDKLAVAEAVRLERFWRDKGDWERLAEAFTDDSWIRTTWFEGGTGREFAEASRVMAERGRHSKHLVTPTEIRINGDRALCESLGEIHNRSILDGIEVDTIMYCRFVSRLRRTEAGWKLMSLEGIYQKDTIAPVNPSDRLDLDWDAIGKLRPSYRIWAHMIGLQGYHISQGDDIVADDRPDLVDAFMRAAEHWLDAGRDTEQR